MLTAICQPCRTSRRGVGGRDAVVRRRARFRADRASSFAAGLARFLALLAPPCARRADHGSVADYPERWHSPFTQVERREMWTYSDGARTVKGYRRPGGTAGAGSWVLVDQGTGNVQGVLPAGEFSRRFRPVDVFADVPRLPGYLGTVTTADGTPLWTWSWIATPSCWLTGPSERHGPMRSWCPAATARDGPRPQLRNWRPVRRR